MRRGLLIGYLALALCVCGAWQQSGLPIMGSTGGSAGGGGTVAIVQHCAGTAATGATSTCTFGSNLAAGHTVVACSMWAVATAGTTGSSLTLIADTQLLTYTLQTSYISRKTTATNGYAEMAVECGVSTVNGSSAAADIVTCTNAQSGANISKAYCDAYELSGVNAGAPIEASSTTGSGAAQTSPSIGSVTTTNANDVILGIFSNNNGGFASSSPGTGFTFNLNDSNGGSTMEDEFKAQAVAGAVTVNVTNSHAGDWAGSALVVRP